MSDEQVPDLPASESEALVAVAKVARVRGLRGEVVADLLTDFPERFDGLERLIALMPDGRRETLKLEDHWTQAERIVLKFEGFDTVDAAKTLVGSELTVPESERVILDDDQFYDWELTGCCVEDLAGSTIGVVKEVLHTGANDVLVVQGAEREHLIPLADEICTEIDIALKLIRVDAPDGLLEL
jgi:16S rRNA processing protein RimM